MTEPLNVLLIEDNDEHAQIISRHIRRAEGSMVRLMRADRLSQGLKRVLECPVSIILLDLRLPDSDIDRTLEETLKVASSIPIVVLSSLEDRDLALKAVHEGAQDYLVKADLSSELLIRAIYSAIERKHTESHIRQQARQSQALYALSQEALAQHDLLTLMNRAVRMVASGLDVEYSSILQINEGKKDLIVKAGFGWREGLVGSTVATTDIRSVAGYAIFASPPGVDEDPRKVEPISILDLPNDKRFNSPSVLHDHDVKSGMIVAIQAAGEGLPFGTLGAYTKTHRIFSGEERSFLQAIANTIAAAILRKNLEEELNRRITELDAAHRKKDEFLATLSHELRTPLNVIIGNLELLKTSDKSSHEYVEALDAIERGARDESQLVSDTLEMSRIITGKMQLEMSQIQVSSLIDSAIHSIKLAASSKNMTVQQNIAPDARVTVGDESRLRQVIWNLLSNAVKFTPPGGRIDINARKENETLVITVRDTGKGIDPINLPHVFERFWQEDSTKSRQFMGLGLGLSIVRHIVEMHGGTVECRSDGIGKGTTFTVRLPTSPPAQNPLPQQAQASASAKPAAAPTPIRTLGIQNLRLLVVDDSVDSVTLLERLLRKKGAYVKACTSPYEGLKEAMESDYDLLISDIGMPELNGYELLTELRDWEKKHNRSPLPAIALTAYASKADAEQAAHSGFHAHLAKPLNLFELSQQIVALAKRTETAPVPHH